MYSLQLERHLFSLMAYRHEFFKDLQKLCKESKLCPPFFDKVAKLDTGNEFTEELFMEMLQLMLIPIMKSDDRSYMHCAISYRQEFLKLLILFHPTTYRQFDAIDATTIFVENDTTIVKWIPFTWHKNGGDHPTIWKFWHATSSWVHYGKPREQPIHDPDAKLHNFTAQQLQSRTAILDPDVSALALRNVRIIRGKMDRSCYQQKDWETLRFAKDCGYFDRLILVGERRDKVSVSFAGIPMKSYAKCFWPFIVDQEYNITVFEWGGRHGAGHNPVNLLENKRGEHVTLRKCDVIEEQVIGLLIMAINLAPIHVVHIILLHLCLLDVLEYIF